MSTRHRSIGPIIVATLGLALTACSASTTNPTAIPPDGGGNTSTPGSGGGGKATVFSVTLNWTGSDPVQGTFTNDTFASSETCSMSATDAFDWGLGFGPNEGEPTTVAGVLVNFLISPQQGQFHGPSTYNNVVKDLSAASDDFSGTNSTLTINADGSGNVSFTSLATFSGGLSESGSITWTCSS